MSTKLNIESMRKALATLTHKAKATGLTLKQMQADIAKHYAMKKMANGGAVDIATIGINEAPDMDIKEAVMPAATTVENAMPTGGVDFQPQMPGRQLAAAAPAGESVGMPGQNMPTMPAPQAASPVAPNAPPTNILTSTPQGNLMQAMKPAVKMAKGGKVKGVVKVKVSPSGDAMMYELTRAQRYTKKVK